MEIAVAYSLKIIEDIILQHEGKDVRGRYFMLEGEGMKCGMAPVNLSGPDRWWYPAAI